MLKLVNFYNFFLKIFKLATTYNSKGSHIGLQLMIFNTLEKSRGELENELLEERLEVFAESLKDDFYRELVFEEEFKENAFTETEYQPIEKELLDKLWRQEI